MEADIKIKPFKKQEGFKYKILQITDIALHSSKRRRTESISKKLKQSFDENKPFRTYNSEKNFEKNVLEKNKMKIELLKLDPNFIDYIKNEEKNGYKILLHFPSEGVPVVLGNDAKEFMASKNGKRIIRGLNK